MLLPTPKVVHVDMGGGDVIVMWYFFPTPKVPGISRLFFFWRGGGGGIVMWYFPHQRFQVNTLSFARQGGKKKRAVKLWRNLLVAPPRHLLQDYFNTFDVSDVRDYMKNLLIALRRVHQLDIIHRDIKPSNFLHNTQTKQWVPSPPPPHHFPPTMCGQRCFS